MSRAEMSYLKMLQYLYIKHQSCGQMVPEAEGRVWPRAAPWAVLQLQFLFSSAISLHRVKHRPRGGWDVVHCPGQSCCFVFLQLQMHLKTWISNWGNAEGGSQRRLVKTSQVWPLAHCKMLGESLASHPPL